MTEVWSIPIWLPALPRVFLTVNDELFAVAHYYRPNCLFFYSLIGAFTIWKVREVGLVAILGSESASFSPDWMGRWGHDTSDQTISSEGSDRKFFGRIHLV